MGVSNDLDKNIYDKKLERPFQIAAKFALNQKFGRRYLNIEQIDKLRQSPTPNLSYSLYMERYLQTAQG
jgi:hypothetical protein